MSSVPSIEFMKTTLKDLYPEYYTGTGEQIYRNFLQNTHVNTDTKITLEPFYQVCGFICLTIEIVSILNQLGLTGDIEQQNIQQQKVKISRKLYEEEFPREKYAYTPVKYEKRETIYYSTYENVKSNEIEANKVIVALYNAKFPDEIKDIHITINNYEILPPVAILKDENKSLTRTVLIAPNMDTNWNAIHNYSKYIYYPLHTFQPAMLQHALAYFFIKNHSYQASVVLNALTGSQPFLSSIVSTLKLNNSDKQLLKNTFKHLFDLVVWTSDYLNGVISSISNVTGNRSKVDPRNAVLLLASMLKDQDIINEFNNSVNLYNNVQSSLPSGIVDNILVQSTHVSYTPHGEYTIVDEKTVQLTAHGQRCNTSNTKKISRNSVIQIIPLLRSKITTKNGDYVLVTVDNDGIASLKNSKLGTTDKKKFVISLPTTSWDSALKISASLSEGSYVTKVFNYKMCFDTAEQLLNYILQYNTVTFNWNASSKIANVKIITRGFTHT